MVMVLPIMSLYAIENPVIFSRFWQLYESIPFQIRAQCNAFRQGMSDVLNMDWLRMFDYRELQTLISGAQIPVDVEDLKNHTNYSGRCTP